MEYILETDGLTKIYGAKCAADKVNLHIREGQIYGLIGRNGAGKTTIMRMISGLSIPTRGDYSLFGVSGPEKARRMKDVGVLIEQPGLYPRLSAYENVRIKAIARGIHRKDYVDSLLKTVGLDSVGKKPARSFSLGMKQRLGIALALVGDPKILILDEPINGLDPQGIVEVREILVRLRNEKGITIMVSSHILDELGKVADAYGIIHDGKLIDEFTGEELRRRSGQYVVIRTDNDDAAVKVLNGMGIAKIAAANDGLRVRGQYDNTVAVTKALVEAGIGVIEIYRHAVTLEDYFLNVTGGKHND